MRRAATAALTVGAVLVLTAVMVAVGAPTDFRHAQLLAYLLVCAVASAVGGRVAWLAAMASCGAALIVTGFRPGAQPHAQDVGLVPEFVVFVGVTVVLAYLVERSARARLRAEQAEPLRQSERLYRLLAENTTDVVYVVDGDVIRWASPSCLVNLGWTQDELAGRRWESLIEPVDLDAAVAAQQQAHRGERAVLRARYTTRDGSRLWTELILGVLTDDAGRPEATLVSARNIDAEVAAEQQLKESQRQRERLIEQLPVGVFRARTRPGGRGELEYVSPRAAELLRYSPDVLDVDALARLIEPADIAALYAAGAEAGRTDGRLLCDVRLAGVRPTVWLEIRANLELVGDDLVIDGTVADVTQAKELGARLAEQADSAGLRAEALAVIDRTRSALLAALGHDLRTPLAVVASAAAGLRDGNLTPGQRDELLAHIEGSSRALGSILTDLLDLGRVEAGALPVRLEPVAAVEVLEEPLRQCINCVRLDLPDDLPDVIADQGLLERVLDNLLRNALRHRSREMPVTVAGAASGGRVLLQIIDHGPGVPADSYERMFVPFQRLTDSGPDGIGLGLSIARAFTEAMGGRLTPSETPGGGLTMTVDLAVA